MSTRLIYLFVVAINLAHAIAAAKHQKLILVDGFTDYISGFAKKYCNDKNIEVIEAVSPYLCAALSQQGKSVPPYLRAPIKGQEDEWILMHDLEEGESDNGNIFCISESDAGVSTAERIQKQLKIKGNGVSHHLRDKFEMNERAGARGLDVVHQRLVSTWPELLQFMAELKIPDEVDKGSKTEDSKCFVLKPRRGVASDGVFLCRSQNEAKDAFAKLIGKPKYEGGINEDIVAQEYVDGQEYAVDTVTKNGETKVVALWKYHKFAINNAPFVYQCSQLVPADSVELQEVCEYCISILKALKVKWGPTHTEIKRSPRLNGPRLIEVNARWHAQNFVELTRACLGYDAVTSTMQAFYEPDKFDDLPRIPKKLSKFGRILHLVSYKEGIIQTIRHLDTIQNLPSVRNLYLPLEIGDTLVKTVDIRTDCGYVVLFHEDEKQVEKDYATILSLQATIFDVSEDEVVVNKIASNDSNMSRANDREVATGDVDQDDETAVLDESFILEQETTNMVSENTVIAHDEGSFSIENLNNNKISNTDAEIANDSQQQTSPADNFHPSQSTAYRSASPPPQQNFQNQYQQQENVRVEQVQLSAHRRAILTITQTSKFVIVDLFIKKILGNLGILYILSHILAQSMPLFKKFIL